MLDIVPPISQISEVILHMKKCKAFGAIVMPDWESAPFDHCFVKIKANLNHVCKIA